VLADGVNSTLARKAGFHGEIKDANVALAVKEILFMPEEVIRQRFNIGEEEGVVIEMVGKITDGMMGTGFLYTNKESLTIGVGCMLGDFKHNPNRTSPYVLLEQMKRHPSIAPLVAGGEMKEYAAHLIPEGGYDAIPKLAADGFLLAGDAAGMCLAAGIWLEGVNFAIGSGQAAGAAAVDALLTGDVSAIGLAGYRERLEANFVLADHRRLRRAPELLMSHRMQTIYPELMCNLAEGMFTVTNPMPKKGALALGWREARRAKVRVRDLARDGWTTIRTFG